ncbi:MAG: AbrB/MazE/SpoVT family DNA-binding domain-containing protein [Oscillospiraceae bacterium]|nr:AbrB/MazE/SpoVT family DNA-binding domain-containing protein [Oscillospiraceae bacterium]
MPEGKHIFGVVKVGERGQIVIPKKAREIFGIHAGDELLVLGDEAQGLALAKNEKFLNMVEQIFAASDTPEDAMHFAEAVRRAQKPEEQP